MAYGDGMETLETRKAIGAALRAERLRLELTQKQCAAAFGGDQPNWAELESGRKIPSLPRLALICHRLGFDPIPILKAALPAE